jgi:ketosteroid isomerase-like protein
VSEANVEIVRRLYASLDEHGSFAQSGLLDPAIEYANPPDAVEPGVRKGFEAFQAAGQSVDDIFERVRFDVHDLIDAGDDVVVALATMRARGRTSGADVANPQGHVWTLANGKAVRFSWFNEHRQALEAAGLAG